MPCSPQVKAYRRADDQLRIVEGVLEATQGWKDGKVRQHDRQTTTKAILSMYRKLCSVLGGGFRASLAEHARQLKGKCRALASECDALSLAAALEEAWKKEDKDEKKCLLAMRRVVRKEGEWRVERPDLTRLSEPEGGGGREGGREGMEVVVEDESDGEAEADEKEYNKAMELANVLFEVTEDEVEEEDEAALAAGAAAAPDLVEAVALKIQAGEPLLWAGSDYEPFAGLDLLGSVGKLMRKVLMYEHDLKDSKRLLVLIPALQGARPRTFTRHMVKAKVREGGREGGSEGRREE
jgi:hypothetical protein